MKKRITRGRYGGIDASQRKEERRKKLIGAGLEAFGTKGYVKTTIRTICAISGLTQRYFYESFTNKEDLLCAVYQALKEEEMNDAMEVFSNSKAEPLQAASLAMEKFFRCFQQDPRKAQVQFFEVLGVSPRIDQEYQDGMRALADMVKIFLCRIYPSIPEETLNRSIIPTALAGSIIFISHEWILNGFMTPLEDIITQLMDLFVSIGITLQAPGKKGDLQDKREGRSSE
ncbi:MAG TPA: TetR/AcrR family transcriptional regulator [Deltaproteobacteria bacterium]|nr:TetR/AcrR family transcriptional regulator [Deltaproteobacteria bacterium]HPJ93976.1 TetR/AcrR family transcriptional regulator [Deltaproteobacteria bacterium]